MDGYDLFRKLSAGAKFDFKRFRSDAEKLHIIRPSKHKEKAQTDKNKGIGNKSTSVERKVNKDSDEDNDDDDDESVESDNNDIKQNFNQEHGDNNNKDDDDDDDDDNDDDDNDNDVGAKGDEGQSSDSESESELNILSDMKSSGPESADRIREQRKKRKAERKKSDKLQADLKQEEINHIRKKKHVHVYGTDIPDPAESFESLQTKYNIHKQLITNIEAVGYKAPTPIQCQAIPVMLHNRDILACAPTGSGKTAAFILPVLHHLKEPRNQGVRALILAPTRELAKQTYGEFQRLSDKMGFRLAYVDKVGKDFEKIKKTFRKTDIMISTPNRLVYLLEQTPPLVSLTSVKWLVVDESDKLFEDGKTGFRDQLATIYKSCDGSVRRAMFSATFTNDVEQWCKLNLDNVVQVYIGAKNTATKTVEQSLLFCGSENGKLLAIRGIIKQGIEPPVLVFVQSKDRSKDLFHELIYDGMNVDVIHAERTQTQRDNVVKAFRSGKVWILICTELMGRGIDFKGVNLVINYDFPNSAISYIHRIGRTGRAGRSGKAITFFTEDDAVFLRSIAGVMKSAGCPVPDYMLKMNKPSKQAKKRLAKSSINRDRICTNKRYTANQHVYQGKKSFSDRPDKGGNSNKPGHHQKRPGHPQKGLGHYHKGPGQFHKRQGSFKQSGNYGNKQWDKLNGKGDGQGYSKKRKMGGNLSSDNKSADSSINHKRFKKVKGFKDGKSE